MSKMRHVAAMTIKHKSLSTALDAVHRVCRTVLVCMVFFGAPTYTAARALSGSPRAVVETLQHSPPVRGGEIAQFMIPIRNAGASDLKISVLPECGCTTVSCDAVVAPGAIGIVRADVQTEPEWRSVTRELDVLTNDPELPRISLSLSVFASPILSISPAATLNLHYDHPGSVTREFTIDSLNGLPLNFQSVICDGPVSATMKYDPAGRRAFIFATLTPPSDGADVIGGIDLLRQGQRPVRLQIVAEGNGLCRSPQEVILTKRQLLSPGAPRASLRLFSRTEWFHIVRVEGAAVEEARWEQLTAAYCIWKIDVTLRTAAIKSQRVERLHVVTDLPSREVIIPIILR